MRDGMLARYAITILSNHHQQSQTLLMFYLSWYCRFRLSSALSRSLSSTGRVVIVGSFSTAAARNGSVFAAAVRRTANREVLLCPDKKGG